MTLQSQTGRYRELAGRAGVKRIEDVNGVVSVYCTSLEAMDVVRKYMQANPQVFGDVGDWLPLGEEFGWFRFGPRGIS